MRVLILRGISGAGKSTYINREYPQAIICSADNYFIDSQGNYNFDPSNLEVAHVSCFRQFLNYCQDPTMEDKIVAVDNTNLSIAEISPYIQAAKAYGHKIKVIRIQCDIDKAADRNTHKVPRDTVLKMAARFEPLPYWYSQETLIRN